MSAPHPYAFVLMPDGGVADLDYPPHKVHPLAPAVPPTSASIRAQLSPVQLPIFLLDGRNTLLAAGVDGSLAFNMDVQIRGMYLPRSGVLRACTRTLKMNGDTEAADEYLYYCTLLDDPPGFLQMRSSPMLTSKDHPYLNHVIDRMQYIAFNLPDYNDPISFSIPWRLSRIELSEDRTKQILIDNYMLHVEFYNQDCRASFRSLNGIIIKRGLYFLYPSKDISKAIITSGLNTRCLPSRIIQDKPILFFNHEDVNPCEFFSFRISRLVKEDIIMPKFEVMLPRLIKK